MEKNCKNCGKSISVFPSKPRKYCSKECRDADKTKEVRCRNCGRVARVPKSISDRPYCSRACQKIYEQTHGREGYGRRANYVKKTCKTCGKEFEILASKALHRHHCSRSCRSKDPEVIARLYRAVEYISRCASCGKPIVRPLSRVRNDTIIVFCNMDCLSKYRAENEEYGNRLVEARKKAGLLPNGLERMIASQFPNLEYVGDGKLWIRTRGGRKCPDFILTGTNKLLEVWGDYWHKGEDPSEITAFYAEAGYECLVILQSEIRRDKELAMTKISSFMKKRTD